MTCIQHNKLFFIHIFIFNHSIVCFFNHNCCFFKKLSVNKLNHSCHKDNVFKENQVFHSTESEGPLKAPLGLYWHTLKQDHDFCFLTAFNGTYFHCEQAKGGAGTPTSSWTWATCMGLTWPWIRTGSIFIGLIHIQYPTLCPGNTCEVTAFSVSIETLHTKSGWWESLNSYSKILLQQYIANINMNIYPYVHDYNGVTGNRIKEKVKWNQMMFS